MSGSFLTGLPREADEGDKGEFSKKRGCPFEAASFFA
jgi:hypothetical protein